MRAGHGLGAVGPDDHRQRGALRHARAGEQRWWSHEGGRGAASRLMTPANVWRPGEGVGEQAAGRGSGAASRFEQAGHGGEQSGVGGEQSGARGEQT